MSHLDLKYPNGTIKAKFVKFLKKGECGCTYDNKPNYFTDGNKVYKRV